MTVFMERGREVDSQTASNIGASTDLVLALLSVLSDSDAVEIHNVHCYLHGVGEGVQMVFYLGLQRSVFEARP